MATYDWYFFLSTLIESGIEKYCKIDRVYICLTLQEYNIGIYIHSLIKIKSPIINLSSKGIPIISFNNLYYLYF